MLMRSRVQSWLCPANHHWHLNWSTKACAVLDTPVCSCTWPCKLITQMKASICTVCEQTELGTNVSSLAAFLVWWEMANELLLCCIPFPNELGCPLLENTVILLSYISQVLFSHRCWGLFTYGSIFISFKNKPFFSWIPPWTEDVYEPVDEETRISCSGTSRGLMFILQPEARTISQQSHLGVYQKQQKCTQLKVYTYFDKSFSSLPE